jgi:hypothetical protein
VNHHFVQGHDVQNGFVDDIAVKMKVIPVHGVGKTEMTQIALGALHKKKSHVFVTARFMKGRVNDNCFYTVSRRNTFKEVMKEISVSKTDVVVKEIPR